jgi:hypothetical protein
VDSSPSNGHQLPCARRPHAGVNGRACAQQHQDHLSPRTSSASPASPGPGRELAGPPANTPRRAQFVGPVIVTLVPDGSLAPANSTWCGSLRGRRGHVGSWCSPTVGGSPSPATTSLGRNSGCTVTLADRLAPPPIRPTGDGFLLVDLGSMNGTLVNLKCGAERLLHDGDEISLGATVLRLNLCECGSVLTVLRSASCPSLPVLRVVRVVVKEIAPRRRRSSTPGSRRLPARRASRRARGRAPACASWSRPRRRPSPSQRLTVGRSGGCNVVLAEDSFVSTVRTCSSDGGVWVEDLRVAQRHAPQRSGAHRRAAAAGATSSSSGVRSWSHPIGPRVRPCPTRASGEALSDEVR